MLTERALGDRENKTGRDERAIIQLPESANISKMENLTKNVELVVLKLPCSEKILSSVYPGNCSLETLNIVLH